jgi:hypothetical protein
MTVLKFFDENPYRNWLLQQQLARWLKRGSRLQTFRQSGGNLLCPEQVLVDVYPEAHSFWMSTNLVALRADVEQLRRQYPCVDQVLKLRAFLAFGFDPEGQFAPNAPHDVLGFLATAEQRLNGQEGDLYILKLRRALARFVNGLYCEDEDDPRPFEGVPLGPDREFESASSDSPPSVTGTLRQAVAESAVEELMAPPSPIRRTGMGNLLREMVRQDEFEE